MVSFPFEPSNRLVNFSDFDLGVSCESVSCDDTYVSDADKSADVFDFEGYSRMLTEDRSSRLNFLSRQRYKLAIVGRGELETAMFPIASGPRFFCRLYLFLRGGNEVPPDMARAIQRFPA